MFSEAQNDIIIKAEKLARFQADNKCDDQVYKLLRLAFRDPALRQRKAEMKQANDFRINHGGDSV